LRIAERVCDFTLFLRLPLNPFLPEHKPNPGHLKDYCSRVFSPAGFRSPRPSLRNPQSAIRNSVVRKVLIAFQLAMNNTGHVPVSETAARRAGATKARRAGRVRKDNTRKNNAHKNGVHVKAVQEAKSTRDETVVQEAAADEATVDERATRARGLLAATLRVWELKHRISD
jgi:hypothetical protein